MKTYHMFFTMSLLPLVACSSSESESPDVSADEMVQALPTADLLVMDFPGAGSQARMSLKQGQVDETASCEAANSEESAEFYQASCQIAGYVNSVVNDVLELLERVTSQSPTYTGDNQYAWGPFNTDEGTTMVFYMRKNEDGSYSYRFDGKTTGADDSSYLTVLRGEIDEAVSVSENEGTFQISYDNIHALYPDNMVAGIVEYDYDRLDSQTGVEARMQGLLWSDGSLHNMVVDYTVNEDSSGDMQFGFTDDVYQPDEAAEDSTAQETARVNSRWLSTGAGRADVTVTEGDLGESTAYRTECWDTGYLTVYNGSYYDASGNGSSQGDSSQCVFENPAFL